MSIQPNASYFPVIFTTIDNYLDFIFLRGKDLVKYLIEILGLGSVTSACLEGFTLLTRAVRSMFYIKIWSLNAVLHWRLVLTQSVHGEYPAVQNVLKCLCFHTYTVWMYTLSYIALMSYTHLNKSHSVQNVCLSGWKWDQIWVLMSKSETESYLFPFWKS